MATLLDASLPTLATRLVPYMREHHSEATRQLDDSLLCQRITTGLRRARKWEFESMFGLSLFVALMFEIAPDFDMDPHIHALLSDRSRPPDARLAQIEGALSEDGWEQLAARGNPKAWEA